MDNYLNLNDDKCVVFEQRLLKNNNDFKDYVTYLRNNTPDSNYEILVFLYLRLILNFNHGSALITEFWEYYTSVLHIDNNNFINFIGDDLLDQFNHSLDSESLIKMMNFFISNNLTNLFDYNFNKLLQISDFETSTILFEQLIINDIEKLQDSSEETTQKNNQYKQFYDLEKLLKKLLRFDNDEEIIHSDNWVCSYILKYIILLKSKNKFVQEKKDKLKTLLISTHSFKDIALYFNKIEHDNIQYLYYKIWSMVDSQETDLREISKLKQLTSKENKFLAKGSLTDVIIIRKLALALSANDNKFNTIVDQLIKDIESCNIAESFQESYTFLIYVLKIYCNYKQFDDESINLFDTNVKSYKSRKIDFKLRIESNNFDHWREFLVLNKYSKESIEQCLQKLDFNNPNNKIENLRFQELGELWVKYASFYENEIVLLRKIIRMCFEIIFVYWKDFECIIEYWLKIELSKNNSVNLLNRIVNYSDIVLHPKDNVNILLSKSFKIWDLCLKKSDDELKLKIFTKMNDLKLIKPETIEYISKILIEKNNFDTWLHLWRNNILINFKDYNYIVINLYNIFQSQIDNNETFGLNKYTKYCIKKDFIQQIIDNSDKKFKIEWILIYTDLIIREEEDSKNGAYIINKIVFNGIQTSSSKILLIKWIELLSNLKDKSIDMSFLSEIRTKQFPAILNLFSNDVLISTNFFLEYINFESMFKYNEQRIRDVYIIAVNLLPPNFSNQMEKLWNNWQEFELKNGHLKDLIKMKKEINEKFKKMGYVKRKDNTNKNTIGENINGGIQFLSGGLVGSNKKQKTENVKIEIEQEIIQ
ncbi:hypothetical protein ACO0SA_003951 [Hanseniaspora valbyensis]